MFDTKKTQTYASILSKQQTELYIEQQNHTNQINTITTQQINNNKLNETINTQQTTIDNIKTDIKNTSTHILKQNETIIKQEQTIVELTNTLNHLRELTHNQLTQITQITQNQREEQLIQQITNDSITALIANCIYESKNLYNQEHIIKICEDTQEKVTKEIQDNFNHQLQLNNIERITDPLEPKNKI